MNTPGPAPLPARQPGQGLPRPPQPIQWRPDPAVLARVLHGLRHLPDAPSPSHPTAEPSHG